MTQYEVTDSPEHIAECLAAGGDDLADAVDSMRGAGLTPEQIVARVLSDPLRRHAVEAINVEFGKDAAELVGDVESFVAASSRRVLVTGPRDAAGGLDALAPIAESVRSWGYTVTTDLDVAASAGTGTDWDSIPFARGMAETLLDVDGVVLAPGWQHDAQAVSTQVQAEALGLPVMEWGAE